MYRPSKYHTHNSSLKIFADLFNKELYSPEIVFADFEIDNMSDDGVILIEDIGKYLVFDWEKRDRYFSNGIFAFNSLGQFERKFHKTPNIDITIQCDNDETHVLVALHKHFLIKQNVGRITDYNKKEQGQMRITEEFMIFRYDEMRKFKEQIVHWLKEDPTVFKDLIK